MLHVWSRRAQGGGLHGEATAAKERRSGSDIAYMPDMPEARPCCIGMLAEDGGYIIARSPSL